MREKIITKQASNALEEYFDILTKTGYLDYETVNKLLVFLFIDDILNTETSAYVTNEDYNTLMEVLNIIYGNVCFLSYPDYVKETPQFNTILATWSGLQPFMQAENKNLGFTEFGTTTHSGYKTEFWDETWSGKE